MNLKQLPLEENQNYYIFCRGHDKGCLRRGAARDLDSEGGVDIYCAAWMRGEGIAEDEPYNSLASMHAENDWNNRNTETTIDILDRI